MKRQYEHTKKIKMFRGIVKLPILTRTKSGFLKGQYYVQSTFWAICHVKILSPHQKYTWSDAQIFSWNPRISCGSHFGYLQVLSHIAMGISTKLLQLTKCSSHMPFSLSYTRLVWRGFSTKIKATAHPVVSNRHHLRGCSLISSWWLPCLGWSPMCNC